VAPQNTALFSRRHIPQSYGSIGPGGRDDIAAGGERDRIDAAVVPLEGKLILRGRAATADPCAKQKRAQQMKRRDQHLASGMNTHCLDLRR
jgi:hypothetical protein